MFPRRRRRRARPVFVAAMCSWLLAATVASGQESVTEETGRVVAIGDICGDFDAFVSVLREAGVDPLPAEELSVSLERIKQKLAQLGPAQSSLWRLDYYVEVYGRAPKIDVLQAFDVHSGPVPYGAPTHAELLSLILPPESPTPPLLLLPGIDITGWISGTSRESRGYQAAPALVSVAPGD